MWYRNHHAQSSVTSIVTVQTLGSDIGCFSKPNDSAWLTISQGWWVRAWEAPLVSLSKFISASVSKLITITALWAVLLSFIIMLMQFLLLYHYKYSLSHVHLSCTIYYNTEALRDSKSSLLSTGGISFWERSALWPLCCPRGRFMAYSLLPTKVYMGEVPLLLTWTSMVT